MGFFKKIKKAVKKVGKAVSKPVKKVAKAAEKVVKPVAKNIIPLAGSVVSAYAGSAVGDMATKGLSSIFGQNAVTKGLGNAVGQGVSNTFNQYANSLGGSKSPSGGVSMPSFGGGSLPASSGSRPPASSALPSTGNTAKDMQSGLGAIKQMETPVKSAAEQGKDTRDYLASAYPELNPWERSGAGGTMFGSEMTGDIMNQENLDKQMASTQALQKQQLAKDLSIAQLNSDTQIAINQNNNDTALRAAWLNSQTNLETAGIASQTSRANTYDQVTLGQRNADLAERRLNSDVEKIAADTELSYQSKKESVAREIQTYAQTQNIKLTYGQIEALTEQALAGAATSRAQAGLIGQQTKSEQLRQPGILQTNENLRYGTGNFSREAQSIGNMITDAASGTWENIKSGWNDMWNNSGGVSGAMSRK